MPAGARATSASSSSTPARQRSIACRDRAAVRRGGRVRCRHRHPASAQKGKAAAPRGSETPHRRPAGTLDHASLADCDVAIEAVYEDLAPSMTMGPCRMLDMTGVDVGAKMVIGVGKAGGLPPTRAAGRWRKGCSSSATTIRLALLLGPPSGLLADAVVRWRLTAVGRYAALCSGKRLSDSPPKLARRTVVRHARIKAN